MEFKLVRDGRKQSSGANTQERMGAGEETDHLLILANLAREHCLTVQRDGQNDWFPVAAGSPALVSTLFT